MGVGGYMGYRGYIGYKGLLSIPPHSRSVSHIETGGGYGGVYKEIPNIPIGIYTTYAGYKGLILNGLKIKSNKWFGGFFILNAAPRNSMTQTIKYKIVKRRNI